jgi:hypothetical protein
LAPRPPQLEMVPLPTRGWAHLGPADTHRPSLPLGLPHGWALPRVGRRRLPSFLGRSLAGVHRDRRRQRWPRIRGVAGPVGVLRPAADLL